MLNGVQYNTLLPPKDAAVVFPAPATSALIIILLFLSKIFLISLLYFSIESLSLRLKSFSLSIL